MKNKKAYSRALKALSARNYSEEEIREKIKPFTAGGQELEDVIERLRAEKLLDDEALARRIMEKRLAGGRGFYYIISEMTRRKIKSPVAARLKADFDFDREYRSAEECLMCLVKRKDEKKAFFSLKARGFSASTLNRLASEYSKAARFPEFRT